MKVILVVLRGTATDRPQLEAAATVATMVDGHIEAIHFRPDPRDALPWVGEGMSAELIEQLMRDSEREAQEREAFARGAFEDWSKAAKLPVTDDPRAASGATASWRVATGDASRSVGIEARVADLVVMQRQADARDAIGQATFESVVFSGGRPVLLLPGNDTPLKLGGATVAILWNGSAEAARAVTASLPLLRKAERVYIVTAEENADQPNVPASLGTYLGWHGVTAMVRLLQPEDQSPADALLAETAALGADLLVMGAYTHSRLRELILGGVTRHVLDTATVPVLMAH